MIVVIGLSGMIVAMWAGLNERRRELAILRSVGASPVAVIVLLALEGFLLTALGVILGSGLLTVVSLAAAPWMQARFGVVVPAWPSGFAELVLVGLVFAAGLLAALLPALRACRLSLADGLTPRL
jgi:putative ABC transport system permease protein